MNLSKLCLWYCSQVKAKVPSLEKVIARDAVCSIEYAKLFGPFPLGED